jgi:hypothetical protein
MFTKYKVFRAGFSLAKRFFGSYFATARPFAQSEALKAHFGVRTPRADRCDLRSVCYPAFSFRLGGFERESEQV